MTRPRPRRTDPAGVPASAGPRTERASPESGDGKRDGTSAATPRLVLFSGFALDGRFMSRQRAIPARVETPEWVDPVAGETVRQFAARMAARVAPEPGPLYLGGASFGATVALEAARVLKPRGVFIIAGALSHHSMWLPLQIAGRLAGHMHHPVLRLSRRFLPLGFRLAGPLHRTHREVLVKLFADADPKQVTWGGPALMSWKWEGPLPCPVYHIHGEKDPMVPLRKVRPDHVIPGAGHAINVTHWREVNEFIAARMGVGTPFPNTFSASPKG